jgi:NAD(P)-dependent dehydrogenase (short-subunit alcohol dehydrogenase family)
MISVLITGANKGIGLEFCRQLAARGDQVIATCRRSTAELKSLRARIIEEVEMTSEESAAFLARDLGGLQIDWLILNAGTFESAALGDLDFNRMRHEYDVDALGPLRVIKALLPNLFEGSKIALISSRAGSIGDNSSGGIYGYRMAKAALNMASVSLARDLLSRGIAVIALHPGVVDTDLLRSSLDSLGHMVRPADAITPSTAAQEMLARIDELTLENSGRFMHRNGQVLPW